MSFNFITKQKKLQWSASYLSEKSCNQWQDHVMSMHNHDEKLDWKYYTEYLRAKLNNSEICNFQTKHQLEAAKQQVNQSIMNFEQYFIKLYADLNYHIFNEICMMYLQMKINEITYERVSLHFIHLYQLCWSAKAFYKHWLAFAKHWCIVEVTFAAKWKCNISKEFLILTWEDEVYCCNREFKVLCFKHAV